MNREYVKFNRPREEYVPSITQADHFSEFPPELIPPDRVDVPTDAIEKDYQELIRDMDTPPPTPPEMEPGVATCRFFRKSIHYVAPIYQEDLYQREFSTRVLVGHLCMLFPTYVSGMIMCSTDILKPVVDQLGPVILICGVSVGCIFLYSYLVGLCRNSPYLYIMLAVRVAIGAAFFSSLNAVLHLTFIHFLRTTYGTKSTGNAEKDQEFGGHENHAHQKAEGDVWNSEDDLQYSLPYSLVLGITLVYINIICIIVLLIKYELPITDYRIPIIVYTVTFTGVTILITLVLNNVIGHPPLGYDLFQVVFASCFGCHLSLQVPVYLGKFYEGRVCPLREGELLYAVLHYGVF